MVWWRLRVSEIHRPHLRLQMPCVYPWFYIQTKLMYNTKQALTCQSHRVLTLLSLDQGANSGVWCHDGIYQQSECRPRNETFGTCKAEKEKYTHQGHTGRQTITAETPRHLAKTFIIWRATAVDLFWLPLTLLVHGSFLKKICTTLKIFKKKEKNK